MDEVHKCPYIVKLVEVEMEVGGKVERKTMLTTSSYFYLFMELCNGGALSDYRTS